MSSFNLLIDKPSFRLLANSLVTPLSRLDKTPSNLPPPPLLNPASCSISGVGCFASLTPSYKLFC